MFIVVVCDTAASNQRYFTKEGLKLIPVFISQRNLFNGIPVVYHDTNRLPQTLIIFGIVRIYIECVRMKSTSFWGYEERVKF